MKLLIVEDELALSEVLSDKFSELKYDVEVAADGEAAISLAKSFKPDLILLDIILPKKSGLEVLEELKGDDNLKTVPVVVLSNLDGDEDIKKAFALGAADYYAKTQHPINEIIEKVGRLIVKSR